MDTRCIQEDFFFQLNFENGIDNIPIIIRFFCQKVILSRFVRYIEAILKFNRILSNLWHFITVKTLS